MSENRSKIDYLFESDDQIEDLIKELAACRWPYERWTHRAHIAVGVWAVRHYDFDQAVVNVRQWIQQYNLSRGDHHGYHETITVFFMKHILAFLKTWPKDAPIFQAVNQLAPICGKSLLEKYYSTERLWSTEARNSWLEPDL